MTKKQDIIPIAQSISNNMIVLTGYGILLSFIIANQLEIAAKSVTFTIWSGWILVIIVRGGYFAHILSDIWATEQDLNIAREKLVSANL